MTFLAEMDLRPLALREQQGLRPRGLALGKGSQALEVAIAEAAGRPTRAASVPHHILGKSWRPGCLVVARYGGDHKVSCVIQYCSSHLLRAVEDLEQECPEVAAVEEPAQHPGIRRIQEIFRANSDRLEHRAEDWRIPAANNLAERDLRPTVIARNVRFGSQSDAGAQTRGILMSGLHTLKKRQVEVVAHLKRALDQFAIDIHQDPFPLLCPTGPT